MRWFMLFPFFLVACDLLPEVSEQGTETHDNRDAVAGETGADGDALEPDEENQSEQVAARGPLGRTVASLGDATESGLWLKTPLVAVEGPGRVTYPATGRSTTVTLIPIDGAATAGSRLSLQAMLALGASLTDLPEIDVSAGL